MKVEDQGRAQSQSGSVRAVTAGLLLGMFLAALDTMIVGTAMPTIVSQLGGMALYSWAFAAYMIASTTTIPIFGRLLDIRGRKGIFLTGVGVFVLGSMLAGTARSMESFILYRAVQGVGAGALFPGTLTMVADLYPLEKRATIQGLFSSVWGIASIVGPLIGGFLVDHLSWRWVFYVNLPVGARTALVVAVYFRETLQVRRRQRIDYAGALALTGSVVALLLLTLVLGEGAGGAGEGLPGAGGGLSGTGEGLLGSWAGLSGAAAGLAGNGRTLEIAALLTLALGLGIAFVRIERRTPEPLLDLSLFRTRIIGFSNFSGFFGSAAMAAVTSLVPLFGQAVLGTSATAAGAALIPMSLAWVVGAPTAGRMLLVTGYRLPAAGGLALIAAGTALLSRAGSATTYTQIATYMAIIGLGLGFSMTSFIIAVQNAVLRARRGMASSSVQFLRNLGNSIGVAVAGAALNLRMAQWAGRLLEGGANAAGRLQGLPGGAAGAGAAGLPGGPEGVSAEGLLQALTSGTLSPAAQAAVREALADSLRAAFAVGLVAALVGLALALGLPRGRAAEHAVREPGEAAAQGFEG